MTAEERAVREAEFSSDRYSVLVYERFVQAFDQETGAPIGGPKRLGTDGIAPQAITGISNLTLTMSVVFDNEVPCCRWNITDWFDWTGTPPNNGAGKDQIGTAWAHGLSLVSDSAYGVYTGGGGTVSMSRNDMTPNTGVGWEFFECTSSSCARYANWGYLAAGIYWPSRRYEPTDVVFKYFHTWSGVEYSLSFSASPGISTSPTSSQSPATIYASFTD